MSKLDADIEALRSWRDQLRAFAERQRDILALAGREIAYTRDVLYEAEGRWRRATEEGQDPEHAAACLGRVLAWGERLEAATAGYRAAVDRYLEVQGNEQARGLYFLDGVLSGLEAYRALPAAAGGAGGDLAARQLAGVAIQCRAQALRGAGSAGAQVAAQVHNGRLALQELPASSLPAGVARAFQALGMPMAVIELQAGRGLPGQSPGAARLSSPDPRPDAAPIAALLQRLGGLRPDVVAIVDTATRAGAVYHRAGDGGWHEIPADVAQPARAGEA